MKLGVFFGHLWAGVAPALNSLKFSLITCAGTMLTAMVSDPTHPLDSPQSAGIWVGKNYWPYVVGSVILPLFRGAQGTAASVQASAAPSPKP